MTDNFYRAFEEKFRGSREIIKERLAVYTPFLLPLQQHLAPAKAIDVGCGRGEWLQIIGELGFESMGVDLDEGMLAACRELNLSVRTQDALECLRELPDDSQAVVSGFHIAEHLPFDSLRVLVSEAKRVLKPGGILILETPNPENLVVGATTFHLDPTHNRPIPPQLLAFVCEYYGFKRTKILRLQESQGLDINNPTLIDVLSGVSPDYSVIAQKNGPQPLIDAINKAFSIEYGFSLKDLSCQFEKKKAKNILDPQTTKKMWTMIDLLNKANDYRRRLKRITGFGKLESSIKASIKKQKLARNYKSVEIDANSVNKDLISEMTPQTKRIYKKLQAVTSK